MTMAWPKVLWEVCAMLHQYLRTPWLSRLCFGWVWFACAALRLAAQTNRRLYRLVAKRLAGLELNATRDFNNSSQAHSGTKSTSVSLTARGHCPYIMPISTPALTATSPSGFTAAQRADSSSRFTQNWGTTAQPSVNLPPLTANTGNKSRSRWPR